MGMKNWIDKNSSITIQNQFKKLFRQKVYGHVQLLMQFSYQSYVLGPGLFLKE